VSRRSPLAAAGVRNGQSSNPVVQNVAGIDLIQVVAPGHHVIAASQAARGLPPVPKAWPSAKNPQLDVQTCAQARVGCVRISALRVRPTADTPVVYAGRQVERGGRRTGERQCAP
jgi:hypothetical protein